MFAPVGAATRYDADWIVPYWIRSLDKIAQVYSHIFYGPRQHSETWPRIHSRIHRLKTGHLRSENPLLAKHFSRLVLSLDKSDSKSWSQPGRPVSPSCGTKLGTIE